MPVFIDVKIISHLAFDPGFSSNSTVLCKSNESEFRRIFQQSLPILCDILKKVNFCPYFDAPIVPISLKLCGNVLNFAWHFVQRTMRINSHEISFGKAKFRQQSIWGGSEISWNMSFVGVEVKLNLDEINKSCA